MKEFICICCPQGCHLQVDEENGYKVTGNTCKRGEEYGKTEATAPVRVLTSTAWIKDGVIDKCPVKTNKAIPKEKIFEAEKEIRNLKLRAPVRTGDVVIKEICGTDADVVVTKEIKKKF